MKTDSFIDSYGMNSFLCRDTMANSWKDANIACSVEFTHTHDPFFEYGRHNQIQSLQSPCEKYLDIWHSKDNSKQKRQK